MKQTKLFVRLGLALLVCLGTSVPGAAAKARNRCKDRCNDTYHLRKDGCKLIPNKRARHACEDAAKHAKNECKHHCS